MEKLEGRRWDAGMEGWEEREERGPQTKFVKGFPGTIRDTIGRGLLYVCGVMRNGYGV